MATCVPAQAQISVLLVDDDVRFRQGIQTLLNFYRSDGLNLQVVGEAATAEQALQLVQEQHPMLVLLDMELAAGDGIDALTGISQMPYRGKVLVLSGHREEEWVFRAMRSGAHGYVVKEDLMTQLGDAIATVLRGQVYLDPALMTGFFQMFRFYSGQSIAARNSLHLTEREHEVLHWLVQGESNEEIATRLFISVATVKAHLTAIFGKLGVTSRTQAIIRALKLGLVSC
jgi:DNA-binding NarL/FixJ family response regulator